MTDYKDLPRQTVEPSAAARMVKRQKDVSRRTEKLERGAPLRNATISGGEGLRVIDETTGLAVVQLLPDGTVVTFDEEENPVVRMGRMIDTAGLGTYGIEVWAGGGWIRLGGQTVDWSQIGNKPASYPPSSHSGSLVNSPVFEADNAGRAEQADGPTPEAFARVVGGVIGEWHAVYMHSNGDFGRGSSGAQYKKNIRDWDPEDPAAILALQPALFDRRANGADDYTPATHGDELGLIAQQVAEVDERLVIRYQGEIDNVRYELLPVAMIPLLRQHHARLEELEALRAQVAQQEARLQALESALQGPPAT